MAPANININLGFSVDDAADNASKKWMIYTADNGDQYKVFITETIGAFLGFEDVTDANIATVKDFPKYFRMRSINFADATGKVKGTYFVGKNTEECYREGGKITVPRRGKSEGVVTFITGSRGEDRRFVYSGDTGQQSGDAT